MTLRLSVLILLLTAGVALATTPDPLPDPTPLPLPSSVPAAAYEEQLFNFLDQRLYDREGWSRDKGVRDTGPYIDGRYYGTHPAVRVFYSPEVYAWLKAGRPADRRIPDGAMIIKEMYEPPAVRHADVSTTDLPDSILAWTVMVRDSAGAPDGWYWSFYAPGQEPDSHAYPFNYPDSGFGIYCTRCHASAESEFTFSSLDNIAGEPGEPLQFRVDESWRLPATDPAPTPHIDLATDDPQHVLQRVMGRGRAAFLRLFGIQAVSRDEVTPIPPETMSDVRNPVGGSTSPEQFVTSNQCLVCHEAQGLPFGPNMMLPKDDTHEARNVSPYGEWKWSMMGLAGRDPVFYAQVESETALHPERAAETQNLCLSCHGVMGQRQWHADGQPGPFTLERMMGSDPAAPLAKYGALGRDGVSCTTCHQSVDSQEPLEAIVTGRFRVAAPDSVGNTRAFGPFPEPITRPMETALGMIPEQSEYISSSRLCASCHTVLLPVFDAAGNEVGRDFEQATYLEWANSDYAVPDGTPRTCQNCHMPDTARAHRLAFRIANIQDQTYPAAEHLAPISEITVPVRGGPDESDSAEAEPPYRRHTLQGVNQFVLEMFRQFSEILGVRRSSYMSGLDNGLEAAIASSNALAKNGTARVEIINTKIAGSTLEVQVRVTNLAGHRFPSGVGFRRAFLALIVKDANDKLLWASGRTDSLGVIVDEGGAPLPSEFHDVLDPGGCPPAPAVCPQAYQPHHEVITSQTQVQIYEELTRSPEGRFTTSFLSLYHIIKDNRLLPAGWSADGRTDMTEIYSPDPESAARALEATWPKGAATQDENFTDGSGGDLVLYRITLPAEVLDGAPPRVEAALYYQSIPPFYLQQRFETAKGEHGRRLRYLTSELDVADTNVEGWKLLIDADSVVAEAG